MQLADELAFAVVRTEDPRLVVQPDEQVVVDRVGRLMHDDVGPGVLLEEGAVQRRVVTAAGGQAHRRQVAVAGEGAELLPHRFEVVVLRDAALDKALAMQHALLGHVDVRGG
ncbi:MAG: hypothetical protein ACK55I_37455, partial [bacterium]